jgi:hypothetical protein
MLSSRMANDDDDDDNDDDRFGAVSCILACYARGRGFDPRTVQTFMCMNMSICIESGCFYVRITA